MRTEEPRVVVMGVAGSGKSAVGEALAVKLGARFVDADSLHPDDNVAKMSAGIPLTDDDRWPWLARVTAALEVDPPVVVACSALRRRYRDVLRAAVPGLRFVFLDITRDEATARVAARASHFFSTSLVDSQFATLESPVGEAGVLRVDATAPLPQLQAQVSAWLHTQETA